MPVSHAHKRARERYQINGALDAQFFSGILRTIRAGGAKLVTFGSGGEGLTYDVPTDHKAYSGTVRVIVRRDLSRIITVLPQKSAGELARERYRELAKQDRARRKQFFRGSRIEENDDVEDNVD